MDTRESLETREKYLSEMTGLSHFFNKTWLSAVAQGKSVFEIAPDGMVVAKEVQAMLDELLQEHAQ